MKRLTRNLLTAIGIIGFPSLPFAGIQVDDFYLDAKVMAVSEYISQGVSYSDKHPVIQTDFGATHNAGFYIRGAVSNVDFDDNNEAEVELITYGGYAKTFESGLSFDIGAIHYNYPGANNALEYNFEEFYLDGGYIWKLVTVGVYWSYSNDYFGSTTDKSGQYLEAKLKVELPYEINLYGHYGHTFGDTFDEQSQLAYDFGVLGIPDSYDNSQIGVSRVFKEAWGLEFDLSYIDIDSGGERFYRDWYQSDAAKTAWVILQISKQF